MSSISTLAQLNSDQDTVDIVELSHQDQQGEYDGHNGSDRYRVSNCDKDEYGSWYGVPIDLPLPDEQIEELRNAVYSVISLEFPLLPVGDNVPLSLALLNDSQAVTPITTAAIAVVCVNCSM